VNPPDDRFCAAVCRNGHVIKDDLPRPSPSTVAIGMMGMGIIEGSVGEPSPPTWNVPRHCGQCGARVLQACRSCDAPILGAVRLYMQQVPLHRPESFCWECGQPYAWATREERIGKLYDEIDHEDLDEATLLTVREQIAVLSAPVDEETDERRGRALERLRDLVPKTYEAVLPVLQGLATAEMKRRLELP